MTKCLSAWMILQEVSAGKDAEADTGEGRELISLGYLEKAKGPSDSRDQASIDTVREALHRLEVSKRELDRKVRGRRGGVFTSHRSLYRGDAEYRKAWDELQRVEEQERTLRTQVVNMVQETADRTATGAVDGIPVRVTYKGRELMVTMEPRLGRVGGMEVTEFTKEIEDVRAHFDARAKRAHEILRLISPSIKAVDEIHLRLASVGLAGSAGEVEVVAGMFVKAWRRITKGRPDAKEPAYVSLAEMIVINARDDKHLEELILRSEVFVGHKWPRSFPRMDEIRASAILLSCGGDPSHMIDETVRLARDECGGSPAAGALLACAIKAGDGATKLTEFQSIRNVVAGHSKDHTQAMTAAALMAAAGLDTEGVLKRWLEAQESLESFDGASMDLPAAMIAILPVNVAEALDNIRLASSAIYAHRLSLGGVENLSLGVKLLMHSSVQAIAPEREEFHDTVGTPSVLAMVGVPVAAVLTVSAGLLAFHATSLHEMAVRDVRFHPVHSHYVYG
jgi:hypothetical protein